MAQHKQWTMPAWMEDYRHLIIGAGGKVEEYMNDHDTVVEINAPRAVMCVSIKDQVALLEALYKRGLLV